MTYFSSCSTSLLSSVGERESVMFKKIESNGTLEVLGSIPRARIIFLCTHFTYYERLANGGFESLVLRSNS